MQKKKKYIRYFDWLDITYLTKDDNNNPITKCNVYYKAVQIDNEIYCEENGRIDKFWWNKQITIYGSTISQKEYTKLCLKPK